MLLNQLHHHRDSKTTATTTKKANYMEMRFIASFFFLLQLLYLVCLFFHID